MDIRRGSKIAHSTRATKHTNNFILLNRPKIKDNFQLNGLYDSFILIG